MTTGVAYPMRLNQHGQWTMDSDSSRKKRLIMSVIMTPLGTREDDPRLGILAPLVFRNRTAERAAVTKFLWIEKLESAVKGIKVVAINPQQVYDDDGTARSIIDIEFIDMDMNRRERVGILLPTPTGSE